jgi:hypothetical protein
MTLSKSLSKNTFITTVWVRLHIRRLTNKVQSFSIAKEKVVIFLGQKPRLYQTLFPTTNQNSTQRNHDIKEKL